MVGCADGGARAVATYGMTSPVLLLMRRRGRRVLEERCEFFATLLGRAAPRECVAKKSSDETSAAPQPVLHLS